MVILFDGLCNLCSASVQFVIARDKSNKFSFASLQSAYGQNVITKFNLPAGELSSFILLKNNRVFTRSTAALLVAKELDSPWPVLAAFMLLPPFLRDSVYNFIAKNRYKWFGKKTSCWLPGPEMQKKFLS